MDKPRKMKKFTAISVWLNVKPELRAANGCTQFTICAKTTSKKRLAELLNQQGSHITLYSLYRMGCYENPDYRFDPPKDEEIYFQNDNTNTPHFGEWLSLSEWKRA